MQMAINEFDGYILWASVPIGYTVYTRNFSEGSKCNCELTWYLQANVRGMYLNILPNQHWTYYCW